MKYPSHLILDLSTNKVQSSTMHWQSDYSSKSAPINPSLIPAANFTSYSSSSSTSSPSAQSRVTLNSLTFSLFDIHFLRKEKLYTKLKYSRCPQYDIVSGGFAAILAGFVGFLISEKFGIELVDSADFYNAFMYGVFGAFALRPLVRVYSTDNTPYSPLSLRYLLLFVRDISILMLRTAQTFGLRVLATSTRILARLKPFTVLWSLFLSRK